MREEDGRYPPSFKAAVALAALRGEQSEEVLAQRFAIPAATIREWVGVLEQHASVAFTNAVDQSVTEKDFFDSGELAKTIAENSTQGFAMMDRNGYCIYANRAWLDMTGYSAQEISSKPLHYLVHHHHPDGSPYPMEECPIDRALPENFDVRAHEDVFFRKDGSTFDVACAASPIFRAGKPIATVIEIRDVTEQKRQARKRAESEQRAIDAAKAAEDRRRELNALLDATPVGIGMANAVGKLILFNRANRELWGQEMPFSESVAEYEDYKGWWADGSPRHGQRLRVEEWALARALQGHDVDDDIVEIEPFNQPGRRKTISLSARPIRDEQENVVGAVVTQTDITRQKTAENALRQADRNKNDFLAILAHELRNPLAPIRNGLEVMRLASSNATAAAKVQEMMARQVEHMVHLIDDLLDMARIDSGKIELKKTRVDLKTIAATAVEASLPMIDAAQHTLEVHIPDVPLLLEADEMRLGQVLTNLLTNAAKYTPEGGHIELAARRDGQDVVVSVSDTGIGIPKAALGSIFDMFSQVERSLGRSQGGLGIGLSLVKRLVQMHGGTVVARSPGEGSGSTFIVRLPLVAAGSTDEASSRSRDATPGEAKTKPLRIVVADDNADAAGSMAAWLRLAGHTVAVGKDGYEALSLVRDQRPDVVFLDIGMPGLNGYEVARLLRASSGMQEAMLVALTGWGAEHDRAEAREAGFHHHLTKPADIRAVEKLLRSFQSSPGE